MRIAVTFIGCLSILTAGCAARGLVEPDETIINPDTGVIAFSVDTRKMTNDDDAWVRPKLLHLGYLDESVAIRLSDRNTGTQRILFEVPAQSVSFDAFELDSGTGIFWNRYRIESRQSIQLTPGEITYVGRIEIEELFYLNDADRARGKPIGVRLAFTDALEDDLAAWKEQYDLFRDAVPEESIVGDWSGSEYLDLWIRESSTTSSSTYRWRAIDSLASDPMRGPAPETMPN